MQDAFRGTNGNGGGGTILSAVVQGVTATATWLGDTAIKAAIGAAVAVLAGALYLIPTLNAKMDNIITTVQEIKGQQKSELDSVRAQQEFLRERVSENAKLNAQQEAIRIQKEKVDERDREAIQRQIIELRALINTRSLKGYQ